MLHTLARRASAAVPALALLTLSGCYIKVVDGHDYGWAGERVYGSGVVVTELRGDGTELRGGGGFDAIEASGGFELVVIVGEPTSVSVRTDDNLTRCIETRVRKGVLHVDQECELQTREGVRIEVSTPELRRLELNGGHRVELRGVAGGRLELDVSGQTTAVAYGAVDELAIDVSGSAELNLFGLESARARLDVSGSATVEVAARDALDIDAEGSARIRYRGSPTLEVSQSGSVVLTRVAD